MLNVDFIKNQFPIFDRKINGKRLVYLDNASTTQKPQMVLDGLLDYYRTMNANIHRGVHTLSEEATEVYEGVRIKVARFLNAQEPAEIIFTRNATEAFNLVAYTYGEQNIYSGDEVVVSALEHHSNLVPWQELCRRKQAILRIIPLTADGQLELSKLPEFITAKCKLVAITQMSNVLGTIVPLEKIIETAHKVGAKVMVDAAQSIAHLRMNVQAMDIDFLAFSSHKMFGPTGVGVLYGKRRLLEKMPPFLFGGDMVREVGPYQANWNDLPWKFEAGTPNIADVIAFGKAIDFMMGLNFKDIAEHDQQLVQYAREKLLQLPGIILYGPAVNGGIVSFNVPGVHPHDVASILDGEGVAVRAGHHCAQPLMQRLKVPATTRMSFSIYNNEADIDVAYVALQNVYKIFKIPTTS